MQGRALFFSRRSLHGVGIRSFRSGRKPGAAASGQKHKKTVSGGSAGKDKAGPTSGVSATRTDTKVLDKAKSTASARQSQGSSGGGSGAAVLFAGVVGGVGYSAYRLKSDPDFATTLRGFGLGAVVDAVGGVMPLAGGPKQEPLTSTKIEQKADSPETPTMLLSPSQARESEATAEAQVNVASQEQATGDDANDRDLSTSDNQLSSDTEGTTNEEISPNDSETSEEAAMTSSGIASSEKTQEGEAAVSAVVEAESQSAEADDRVKTAIEEERDDALAVVADVAGPSEMEVLREQIRVIEDSVAEEQADVRRKTVSELQVQQAELRGELEDMLARDLTELDIADLRKRVVQLVMELQERNKMEAAKLVSVLEAAELRSSKKASAALRDQAEKYEELIQANLREQEARLRSAQGARFDEHVADSTRRLQEVADELQNAHRADLEAKLALSQAEHDAELAAVTAEQRAVAAADATAQQAQRVAAANDMRLRLQALDKVFQQNAEYLRNSHQIHVVCTALLALHSAMSQDGKSLETDAGSLADATAALRVASQSDAVICAALDSLPKSALARVASLSELETRFSVAREESRKALYTPNNSGVVGHALGSVAAGLTVMPSGLVDESQGTEAYLARAHHYVSRGDIRSALNEVAKLEGDAAAIMVDWVEAARSRLLVEQAMRMIGAHVTTLAATLT